MLLATALATRALFARDKKIARPWWLVAALSVEAGLGIFGDPADPHADWYDLLHRATYVLAAGLIGVWAAGSPRQRRWALWAIASLVFALALLAPIGIPQPDIDVWKLTQICCQAFGHGVHPYTATLPDTYGGGFYYGYHTTTLPYLPAVVMALTPSTVLLGDYRFLSALCVIASFLLLRAGGRKLGISERSIDLISLAWLLQPRLVYIVENGFTEPLLLVALAAFFYFHARAPGRSGAAIALLLLPSLKQYVISPPFLYLGLRPRLRALAIGALVAASTAIPLLLWNWRATLTGAFFQKNMAARADAISITALILRATGHAPPLALGIVAEILVTLAMIPLLRRAQGHARFAVFLVGGGLSLAACFLFAPQAFVNYYLFATAWWLMAGMAWLAPEERA